jgi:hypothetical protein
MDERVNTAPFLEDRFASRLLRRRVARGVTCPGR